MIRVYTTWKIHMPWFPEWTGRIIEGNTEGEIDTKLGQTHDKLASSYGVNPECVELLTSRRE